ncbi:hypothetical protein J0B03_08405 [Alkalibacter rhizosphaerae]|uniref:Uncharacterized protein n=1 Tax=Alkalibacter rhizosphaerae TaxID=2815577 RepID=A0A974XFL3_9FIRM|nr:hypothetical protein [Alkalibacter rhizosphaerae]QSX07830.1 hypothetical protein J0B03_08405 [Alkalibacter rhizosphaerae]
MNFWSENGEKKIFAGGKDHYEEAAALAGKCIYFKEDDEDEQMAPEKISCYNCRYRRWTADSFQCMKKD